MKESDALNSWLDSAWAYFPHLTKEPTDNWNELDIKIYKILSSCGADIEDGNFKRVYSAMERLRKLGHFEEDTQKVEIVYLND